jgi:hypothetical protein
MTVANEESPPVAVSNIVVHPGDLLEVAPGPDRLGRTVRLKLRAKAGAFVAVLECERVPPDGMRVVAILMQDELRAILRPQPDPADGPSPRVPPALGSPDQGG